LPAEIFSRKSLHEKIVPLSVGAAGTAAPWLDFVIAAGVLTMILGKRLIRYFPETGRRNSYTNEVEAGLRPPLNVRVLAVGIGGVCFGIAFILVPLQNTLND
jgi:hypothetical protein